MVCHCRHFLLILLSNVYTIDKLKMFPQSKLSNVLLHSFFSIYCALYLFQKTYLEHYHKSLFGRNHNINDNKNRNIITLNAGKFFSLKRIVLFSLLNKSKIGDK